MEYGRKASKRIRRNGIRKKYGRKARKKIMRNGIRKK